MILLKWFGWLTASFFFSVAMGLAGAFLYLNPQIPEISSFTNVALKAPLRILSSDNRLIQEYGERLMPIRYEDIPPQFINAILDTEDKRFFEHGGIDLITLLNASWQLVANAGEIKTGASTITMQLVKNISGDSQVRFIRKFKEMLLAIKLERELTKQEILTLYLNIIPFGKHAYGIQAAAYTYYDKDISELNLAQTAMLAGIPKAPEAGNPINGPSRALARRNLILRRMLEQGSITQSAFDEARRAPITAQVYSRQIELSALYVAEQVRTDILERFGREAYSTGLSVQTTLDSQMQTAAQAALTRKLNEYDRRHGYRGPEKKQRIRLDSTEVLPASIVSRVIAALDDEITLGDQIPALVISATEKTLTAITKDGEQATLEWPALKWARPYIDADRRGPTPRSASEIARPGDLIRVERNGDEWRLGQVPNIQGALVAIDPQSGAVRALAGGYDFNLKQFNHAIQAKRQPGSNIKPFYYAAAIEEGATAASLYNDAPVVLDGGALEEKYRPKNSGSDFKGTLTLREALYRSVNLASLRVLLDLGIDNAIDYMTRFGFEPTMFPRNVQIAFGGGTIATTPLEIAAGYAIFANGGSTVSPYFIESVSSINEAGSINLDLGEIGRRNDGDAAPVIDPRVSFIVNSILNDTIKRGTGRKILRELGRDDIMGKTGTTNDADLWFSGYNEDLVATAWAGFPDNSPVGNREWGSTTPIETWIEFARTAWPEEQTRSSALPDGLVSIKINPETGQRTLPGDKQGEFEFFRSEMAPRAIADEGVLEEQTKIEQIF